MIVIQLFLSHDVDKNFHRLGLSPSPDFWTHFTFTKGRLPVHKLNHFTIFMVFCSNQFFLA